MLFLHTGALEVFHNLILKYNTLQVTMAFIWYYVVVILRGGEMSQLVRLPFCSNDVFRPELNLLLWITTAISEDSR